MERNSIKQLLMSSNFFVLNKKLVKDLGIETAFFLTVLAEADDTLSTDEGWFYQTTPMIEKVTGLSEHKQKKCISKLISLGILEQENKGMPMKRYFRLNYKLVLNILTASTEKISDQAPKNFESKDLKNSGACSEKNADNKELNINNLNKKNNKIDDNNIYTIPEKKLDDEMDILSIEFKNNFKEYKELVSKSTGVGMNIVDNLMANIIHTLKSQYDIKFLIQKIKESDFLMGKLETKPSTANFSKRNMLDRIMADEYKNKTKNTTTPAYTPAGMKCFN